MLEVWTGVTALGVLRRRQMSDIFLKQSLQDLLTVQMCGIKEFEKSRMTLLVLA